MSTAIETNGTPDLASECKKWQKQCAELIEERERLGAELAKVKSERDQYLKSLYYYIRKDAPPLTFTKEEAFAAIDNKQSFGELVAEMEKQYGQGK